MSINNAAMWDTAFDLYGPKLNVYFSNVQAFGALGDGVHDDTAAIQNAIIAAQIAGGGTVYFPATGNFYLISSTISIFADNIELIGESWGAQIQPKTGFTGNILQVQGPGGAGNFRYGIRIANLFFNGNNLAGVNGLDLVSCYSAVLEHLRIRFVSGISVHWDGIGGAFGAYNHMHDCHVTDGGSTAVGLQTDSSEWLLVTGGEFGFFSGGTAIAVLLQNLNNRIIGVGFDHNDISVQLSFAGRNIIQGCEFDRGFTNFIYLRGTSYCTVEGNVFCTSSGGTDLIKVTDNGNAGNVISGNTCTASTWTNFVNELAGTGSTIPNQYISNQIGSYGVVRATNSGIFRYNQGYNPRGSIVPATFPATTVNATNNSGSDVTAYIVNGANAITQIQVAGVTTGLTIAANGTGQVFIPAGSTVNFTYAGGAPSWTWFGN
jgi:hypothetical protein